MGTNWGSALHAPPQLNISLSPTNTLALAWASPTAGYLLQANASLGTTNWVTLTNAPVTIDSNNLIVLTMPASNRFYRIMLP
jgi:hypothetical protein